MSFTLPQGWRTGEKITADRLNEGYDAIREIAAEVSRIIRPDFERPQECRPIWVRLVGGDATTGYDFVQVRRASTDNGWENMPGGIATTSPPATMTAVGLKAYAADDDASFTTGASDGDVVSLIPTVNADHQCRFAIVSGGGGVSTIIIKITGSALQASHDARWDYAFTEQEEDGSGGWQDKSGGLSGTTGTDPAQNLAELAHIAEPAAATPWYVWGVDAHGDDFPSGFVVQPVGGGGTASSHKVDQYVTAFEDADGTVWFDRTGTVDGDCS